jgi:beta-galactosidase
MVDVQRNSTTFLNGRRIGTHASGYTSFHYRLDDSSALSYGPEEGSLGEEAEAEGWNVLAVHVDATAPDGWWYDGGGIYRNVREIR